MGDDRGHASRRLRRRFPAVIVVLGVLLAAPAVARAQSCTDAAERLNFVRERIRADAHDARLWAWGWGLGYTALALGQGGLALTRSDAGERADLWVGAGKSALGLVPLLFVPVPAVRDAGIIDGHLVDGPAGDDRCSLLPEAELMLRRSADDEAFARGWLAHTATVAVNAGGLLIGGLGYQRWRTGIIGALIGTAVGEVQIFTRPTSALRGRRGYNDRWAVGPMLERDAIGVHLAGSY